MKRKKAASPTSSPTENRRRSFFRARRLWRFWPAGLSIATATACFVGCWWPASARRRDHLLAAGVPADRIAIEQAVAAAAIRLNAKPGDSISVEGWRTHLPSTLPSRLREEGRDPFGHSYGPQRADREVEIPPETLTRLSRMDR